LPNTEAKFVVNPTRPEHERVRFPDTGIFSTASTKNKDYHWLEISKQLEEKEKAEAEAVGKLMHSE
jgi:hypothetical protein